jgi:hypothetical protein
MAVNIIQDSDRSFIVRLVVKSSQEPLDLTGLTGEALRVKMDGEDETLVLDLDNGVSIISAIGGKIRVTLNEAQTLGLKPRDGQTMEIVIRRGAGPDFDTSVIQIPNAYNVAPRVYEITT